MARVIGIISLLLSFNTFALGISVVSDLDDTIKVTNTLDLSEAIRNALFSKKSFGGMISLLNELNSYSNGLYVLSASPDFLNSRVQRFISYHGISTKKVYLRNMTSENDKKAYKIDRIRKVLNETTDDQLILIGDNSQVDHEVYQLISKENPTRIVSSYVRYIKKETLPKNIIGFYTDFDIAYEEFLAGRMTFEQVRSIGERIVATNKMSRYFPHFVFCPSKKGDFKYRSNSELTELVTKVQNKIIKYCKKNN